MAAAVPRAPVSATRLVLLVTAGLVTRSFQRLRGLDLGFAPDGVLSLQLDPRLEPTSVNGWMLQLIDSFAASGVDVLFGGGRNHFTAFDAGTNLENCVFDDDVTGGLCCDIK